MGCDINAQNNDQNTPLVIAVKFQRAAMVDYLVRRGADPHLYDFNRDGALLWAAYYGNVDIIKTLLYVARADTSHTYIDGRNSLMWAVKQGHIDAIKHLYFLTNEVNRRDMSGNTIYNLARSLETKRLLKEILVIQKLHLTSFFKQFRGATLLEPNLIEDIFGYIINGCLFEQIYQEGQEMDGLFP
jgi:ankyrin repeat protein